MGLCLNCGAALDAGAKFCMECGTLVPQIKKCVQCGMELPLKAKFCFGCGAPQDGAAAQMTGFSMGDKNVIAGDVIGQKVAGDNVQNKVLGNVINNTIHDETKKIISCHVCGKHLANDNAYTCPGCGKVVCCEHFNLEDNLCQKCSEDNKEVALKQYETALLSAYADGMIDVIERKDLDELANSLGLLKSEIQLLEQKILRNAHAPTLTQTNLLLLKEIKKAFFTDEFDDAFADIKKLYARYPSNEEVVTWYLRFARVINSDETLCDIAKRQGKFCEEYLSLVCIYIAKEQMPEAEIALNKAKQYWSDSALVKCIEVLFLIKLFKMTGDFVLLKDAASIAEFLSPNDDYEEFVVKNLKILLELYQKKRENLQELEPKFLEKFFDLKFVVAKNKSHLKQLILNTIEKKGYGCDLNFIDVSNVADMSCIFYHSQFNGDISQWEVSNVTNMRAMFAGSQFNGDISHWDVSKVTDMGDMFGGSQFNGDISQWDVSNVTDMYAMFAASQFNGDISKWCVSSDCNVIYMFYESDVFLKNHALPAWKNFDISGRKVVAQNKIHLYGLIYWATLKYGWSCDLNFIDVSNVTDMSGLFSELFSEFYCSQFNGDISQWNVSNVTDMSEMFSGSQFNGDISQWNVSKEAKLERMFDDSLLQKEGKIPAWKNFDISGEKIVAQNKTHLKSLIYLGALKYGWTCNLNFIDVSNVADMSCMFDHSQFNGDISQWDVSNVTNMSAMFAGSQFNGDISHWDVSNVTDMSWMFYNSQFNGDICRWDVSKETKLERMFDDSRLQKEGMIPAWYKKFNGK